MKKLHEPVQPLHEFHSGYDEVGAGAWVNSTVCQQLLQNDPFANLSLKQYFFTVSRFRSGPVRSVLFRSVSLSLKQYFFTVSRFRFGPVRSFLFRSVNLCSVQLTSASSSISSR